MMSSTDSRAQSLMLSSHIFLGVLRILFISIVLCNNPLEMLLCLQMWPYRNHFLFFIPCRSGYWEPAKSLYCMQHFFFLCSLYQTSKIHRTHFMSRVCSICQFLAFTNGIQSSHVHCSRSSEIHFRRGWQRTLQD